VGDAAVTLCAEDLEALRSLLTLRTVYRRWPGKVTGVAHPALLATFIALSIAHHLDAATMVLWSLLASLAASSFIQRRRPWWFSAWREWKRWDATVFSVKLWWFSSRYLLGAGALLFGLSGVYFDQEASLTPIQANITSSMIVAGTSAVLASVFLFHRRRAELRDIAGQVLASALSGVHVSEAAFDAAIDELAVGFRSGRKRRRLIAPSHVPILKAAFRVSPDPDTLVIALGFQLRVIGMRFASADDLLRHGVQRFEKMAVRRDPRAMYPLESVLEGAILTAGATPESLVSAGRELTRVLGAFSDRSDWAQEVKAFVADHVPRPEPLPRPDPATLCTDLPAPPSDAQSSS